MWKKSGGISLVMWSEMLQDTVDKLSMTLHEYKHVACSTKRFANIGGAFYALTHSGFNMLDLEQMDHFFFFDSLPVICKVIKCCYYVRLYTHQEKKKKVPHHWRSSSIPRA